MISGSMVIAPNIMRTAERARARARGLGDINVSTTPPGSAVIAKQLKDAIAYYNYVVDQYQNHNHFGGQSAEWMSNFASSQQATISSLQAQLATAQQGDAATNSLVLANTSLLTPSAPGWSIQPSGPSATEVLQKSTPASASNPSASMSQPTSYKDGGKPQAQESGSLFSSLPWYVYVAGAALAAMAYAPKSRKAYA